MKAKSLRHWPISITPILWAFLVLASLFIGVPAKAQTADMCALLARRPAWVAPLRHASDQYDVSAGAILAVIDQESRFVPNARGAGAVGENPARNFGLTQASLTTWNWFLRASGWDGNRSRTDFAASFHFIAWHFNHMAGQIHRPASDVTAHYLVYKLGLGGYRNGTPASARSIAELVATRAHRANSQLANCAAYQGGRQTPSPENDEPEEDVPPNVGPENGRENGPVSPAPAPPNGTPAVIIMPDQTPIILEN